MTTSSLSRAERRLLRRLHTAALGRLAAGDERFFDRHPERRTRLRFAGQAEVATVSAVDVSTFAPAGWGLKLVAAVRRVAPGATVKVLFPGWEREDVDVSEREAAATFDLLAAIVPDGVRIVTTDLIERAARMGGAA